MKKTQKKDTIQMVSDNIGKIRKYQSIYLFVAKQSQGGVSLNLLYETSLPGGHQEYNFLKKMTFYFCFFEVW